MNSSISASDGRSWRRLLLHYAAATVLLGLVLGGLLLALDPYDTGRFSLVPSRGVPDVGQRLAFASIGRQPGIATAILGNSTIQLLDPARLGSLTGQRAASLAVPGSGPLEQLAIAEWFRRHHPGPTHESLVFGLDAAWCTTRDPIVLQYPFPFWLYAADRLDYAVHMMRYKSFEAAWRKVKLLLGRERAARPDGYHDYDTGHTWTGRHDAAAASGDPAPEAAGEPDLSDTGFTAPKLLARFLARLDRDTTVVLVFVPVHASALSPSGSVGAERLAACKSAYRAIAAARPHTKLLDFRVDSAMAEKDENFWDSIHYRGPVARAIEDELVVALRS